MYSWKEMSMIQKVLVVAGWISIVAWFVLTIVDEVGVLETTVICRALQAIWCLGLGCMHKKRWMRAMWYVIAGWYCALCVQALF